MAMVVGLMAHGAVNDTQRSQLLDRLSCARVRAGDRDTERMIEASLSVLAHSFIIRSILNGLEWIGSVLQRDGLKKCMYVCMEGSM